MKRRLLACWHHGWPRYGVGATSSGVHRVMQAPCALEHAAAAAMRAGGTATPAVSPAAAMQVTQAALQAVWQVAQARGPPSTELGQLPSRADVISSTAQSLESPGMMCCLEIEV